MVNKVTFPFPRTTDWESPTHIEWKNPKFGTEMDFSWCEYGFVNFQINGKGTAIEGDLRFKMFCRKDDHKCFIEDIISGDLHEFNGAKAAGMRIAKIILVEENKEV